MIRLACAVLVAAPTLGGCSKLLRSDDAEFRTTSTEKDDGGPRGGPSTSAANPACVLLGAPEYLKAPERLSTAMFGGHLSAHGDTLIVNALLESPGLGVLPAEGDVDPPRSRFCAGADAPPANAAGSGAMHVYEGAAPHFDSPSRTIAHSAESFPVIPRERLKGLAAYGVLPTHPSAAGESWLVIGDASHEGYRGLVRYWSRKGDGTGQETEIPSPVNESGTFGRALALDGDTLVVGAPSVDNVEQDVGAAYVYELGKSDQPIARLDPEELYPDGWFGSTVAISSRWIAVAATGDGTYDGELDGVVQVYERVDGGVHPNGTRISRPKDSAIFGASVAIQDDWMAIGAPATNVTGTLLTGKVYLYHYLRGSWQQVESQTFTGPSGSFTGWSVAFAPGALLVTSPFENVAHDGGTQQTAGTVRIFEFGAEGIRGEPCPLISPNPTPCDVFGNSLAVGSDFVAVGAPREDGDVPSGTPDEANGVLDSGAVYVYPARWTAQSEP